MTGAIPSASDLLDIVGGYVKDPTRKKSSADRPVRLAVVNPAYSGSGAAKVTFEGETVLSTRSYVTLTPVAASERVLMVPVGNGYAIVGTVGIGAWYATLGSRLTALESKPAVQGVIPSSVTVGSGSASVATDGTITFTGASSWSPNNVFDGTGEDRYLVEYDFITSGAATLGHRLRTGGGSPADDASSVYDSQRLVVINTVATGAQSLAAANWVGSGGIGIASARHVGTLEISAPALAQATIARLDSLVTPNPMTTSSGLYLGGLQHRTASAYGGISFILSTGTGTGTMKVVKIG